MLEGGEDPKFIARRMIILASEDIGNAAPGALTLATSCFTAVDYIGMPEARIVLSQTATYLASCPKSNAASRRSARRSTTSGSFPTHPVPLHLRNAPTQMMKEMGYGAEYKYSHDFDRNFVEQQYLPDSPEREDLLRPHGQRGRKEHQGEAQRLVEEEAAMSRPSPYAFLLAALPVSSSSLTGSGAAGGPLAQDRTRLRIRPSTTRQPQHGAITPRARRDSLKAESSSGIDTVVTYLANDSIRYDLKSRTMFMYGKSNITYKDLGMKAENIDINWTTSLLNAQGVADTVRHHGEEMRGLPDL